MCVDEETPAADAAGERKPMEWSTFLGFERGLLWDYICAATGVENNDIVNCGYLGTSPTEFVFDFQYNLFRGTAARAARAAREAIPDADDRLAAARTKLGIRPGKSADTYYGQLIWYAWHDSKHEQGAHFTPIYHLLGELKTRFPMDERRLEVLRRRLVHVEIMRKELETIEETYDPRSIPILLEWTTNRLEAYISQSAQLLLLLVEYHASKHGRTERLRFENMFDALPRGNVIYSSLMPTVDGYLLSCLRNEAVHADGFEVALDDDKFVVTIETSDRVLRFTGMREFLESDIASLSIATEAGREERAGVDYVRVRDPRFAHVEFLFRRSKAGTLDVNSTIIRYKMTLQELLKKESGLVFIFAREMLVDLKTGRTSTQGSP